MARFILVGVLVLLSLVFAKAQDAIKFHGSLAPIYQDQRNQALDGLAQCSVIVIDLRAKIADLEKQLKDAKDAQAPR